MRLNSKYKAVFYPVNADKLKLLKIVEPYVTWGFPNKKTIEDLVLKRGYSADGKDRKPLTDNKFIEEQLGESTGIICVEDIIHELWNFGPNFKKITEFLCVFKLEKPKGGFPNKRKCFAKGGEIGNRKDKINELLQKMI